MSIAVVDTLSLLALLASPLFVGLLSSAAENWVWFQSIAPNGRISIIAVLSALLGIGSVAAQHALAQNPALLGTIDPYMIIVIPALNYLVTQIVHGTANAKTREVTTAKAAKEFRPA